jgi:hypothetical protein
VPFRSILTMLGFETCWSYYLTKRVRGVIFFPDLVWEILVTKRKEFVDVPGHVPSCDQIFLGYM